jgi:hypothetical protein
MKHSLLAALAALPLAAHAIDPIALYSFESEDTGTTPETISATDVELEFSPSMATDSWSILQNFTGPASTSQVFTDAAASPAIEPAMFYRIKEAATE